MAVSKKNPAAKKQSGKRWTGYKYKIKQTADPETNKRLLEVSGIDATQVLTLYNNNTATGFNDDTADGMRDKYGSNEISYQKKDSVFKRLFKSFINPFTLVLLVLAVVSVFTDVIFAEAGQQDFTAIAIVLTMVIVSGILGFVQDTRSNNAAEKLKAYIQTTTCVLRDGKKAEIPFNELVVGDIVYLTAGDIIPADMRVISSKDLFVSQSSLTGESLPIEKFGMIQDRTDKETPLDKHNLTFTGSTVVSGSAVCIAISVGDNTVFGSIARGLNKKKTVTSFEKGVNSVSKLLIGFMCVMVPVVFFVSGMVHNDWLSALLFGLAVAVGLTPEMLPMIVTANLAKGAVKMAKKKTVVKNMHSIQNFGAMDVLCTDKTGTLTQDRVVLERYLDINGTDDFRVLKYAYMNSKFQTGLKNLIDIAVLAHGHEKDLEAESNKFIKIDEIPFDFVRRRMSVVVKDDEGKTQLITKGAIEEMLECCDFAGFGGKKPLKNKTKDDMLKIVAKLNSEGMRVLGVAQKYNPAKEGMFSVADETGMHLIGFLAFLDPPKETTKDAIKALNEYGVAVKVLTGDNGDVTRAICKQVGLNVNNLLLGSDITEMDDEQLKIAVEKTNVFAKLTPSQKVRIVHALRENGHVVGFMGDGINDAPALREADVGISVDTAVDISKEAADIILLEKDLMVLEQGVIEGRKTFANIIKYIKMTASSNFGNMFSLLVACAFLPFLPLLALQILFLNLIYDISCISIPWDNVDKDYLKKPRRWDSKSIRRFMLWIGPSSSVFDITTYALLFFLICPMAVGGQFWDFAAGSPEQILFIAVFHAGWFIESLWTQTLVIHMIRTPKIPFLQSRASLPVILFTTAAIAFGTIIPFTVIGSWINLSPVPAIFFAWLVATVLAYMVLVTVLKKLYVRRYKELL
ncbi:MAG: magnesium-translocating P-type ATPase [Firmicutes bacterium]|nr:magnesium-translocating P-type ATPase [Bacillota bacterium]